MRLNAKQLRQRACALAVSCALAAPALANPNGPAVVHGQARFQVDGKTLSITNSPGTIINWQGFSISADELTRFLQQSPVSSVLNRVISANPSEILGRLQSNGRVFLVNPNGIVFGRGSQVDVAGFAASTLNISNADFLSGRHVFSGTGAEGKIVNQGEIITPAGGKVYLVAPQVENSGIIRAPSGEIVLAAGRTVRLVDANFPSIHVEVSATGDKDLPLGNLGVAGKVFAYAVKQSGIVSASAASTGEGGRVVLKSAGDVQMAAASRTEAAGASGGSVAVQAAQLVAFSGAIDARGLAGTGGSVAVEAPRVIVAYSGSIDVSGASGGGRVALVAELVRFAGTIDARGLAATGGSVTVEAPRTLVAYSGNIGASGGGRVALVGELVRFAGTIDARAGRTGDGGTVVMQAAQLVAFSGSIDARGLAAMGGNVTVQAPRTLVAHSGRIDVSGASGGGRVALVAERMEFAGGVAARAEKAGDGGFVEVSGRQSLVFTGSVDTRAAAGKDGTLLIDPAMITVMAGSLAMPPALADGTLTANEGSSAQTIGATELTNLLKTTSVTLQATDRVHVAADAVIEAGAPGRALTLQAPQVVFQGTLRTTGAAVDLNIEATRAQITQDARLALGGGRVNVAAQAALIGPVQEAQRPRMQETLERAATPTPPEVSRLRAEVLAEIDRDNARIAAAMSQSCSRAGAPKQGCTVSVTPKRFASSG